MPNEVKEVFFQAIHLLANYLNGSFSQLYQGFKDIAQKLSLEDNQFSEGLSKLWLKRVLKITNLTLIIDAIEFGENLKVYSQSDEFIENLRVYSQLDELINNYINQQVY